MSQKQTVVINGREYDAHTGLPVASDKKEANYTPRQALRAKSANVAPVKVVKKHQSAQSIHTKAQRSTTLNRKFIKKPSAKSQAAQTQPSPVKVAVPAAKPKIATHTGTRIDGMRPHRSQLAVSSPTRATIAAHQKQSATSQQVAAHHAMRPQPVADIAHVPHPSVTRAHQVQAARKQQPTKTLPAASVLKKAAINEALAQAPKHNTKQHKQPMAKRTKLFSVVCGCAALILFGGYLTYLNAPNLSVRVAAAQAGIDATYPNYQPDGYRLNGPVAYSNGQVQMKFAANTGDTNFTLKQSSSSWDSSALLENYVKEKSNNDYTTSQEKGVTVYSYGGNAAWVSGGILYTIDGNAPLSPDQIRKIATSV